MWCVEPIAASPLATRLPNAKITSEDDSYGEPELFGRVPTSGEFAQHSVFPQWHQRIINRSLRGNIQKTSLLCGRREIIEVIFASPAVSIPER